MANKTTPATTVVPPNAGGSNKSTPAPKVAVSAGIKKWLWLVAVAVAVIIGITLIASIARSRNNTKQPIADEPLKQLSTILPQDAPDLPWAWHMDQSKWPRVLVPAHGDSIHVPSFFGGHIVWGGSGFKVHYIYSDGHECVLGDTSSLCGDGNIVAGYAHNESETPLYASYAYARKDEK